ncbi:hypothetical protein [Pseudoramibacter sp.]|jgi:hypothetical protein|uniref:hypothetical protein n=1 Tax=Pseudoramibacter sp. TaxID=2034862 RepID=UPI0025EF600C|nr:hypothetical protein [Pseudoramibacter sp.]MCH4072708.1 hypothetical protein [Pseudoramibacter sp.]MCH4106479.1 hypothetical protein [Pseudoramibacter sp.]
MSQQIRKKKRQAQRKRILMLCLIFLTIIILGLIIHYRYTATGLLEQSEYKDVISSEVYFFKHSDYIEINNFSAQDLTSSEGSKVNGYTPLTKNKMSISSDYLNAQISTINQILKNKDYLHYNRIVSQIQNNFKGLDKLTSQLSSSQGKKKTYLVNASAYFGMSRKELIAKRKELKKIKQKKHRQIILSDLGMQSSGYVYGTVNPMEKVVTENVLPYIDKDFLESIQKIDQQDESALKIVDNDHLYAAFTVDSDTTIQNESNVKKLKQKVIGTSSRKKDVAYYNKLVKRVDLLWQYPQISIVKNNKSYPCYVVNVFKSGSKKIVVVMLKDYISVFANDNILKSDINIQSFQCYQVPKSAIKTEGKKQYLTLLQKGYFRKKVAVKVRCYDGRKAILSVEDNPDLSANSMYCTYP